MPFPATHVLFNIGLFYPFRKYLGKYWLVFAGLSGLIPDLDFALQYLFNLFGVSVNFLEHGMFFHTFIFGIPFFVIGLFIYLKNKEYGKYSFIIGTGVILHVVLDYILGGGRYFLMFFFPLSDIGFRLHLLSQYNSDVYGIIDAIAIFISLCFYYIKLKLSKKERNNIRIDYYGK